MKYFFVLFAFINVLSFSQETIEPYGVVKIQDQEKSLYKVGDHLDLEMELFQEVSLDEIKKHIEETKSKFDFFHVVDVRGEYPVFFLQVVYEKAYKDLSDGDVIKWGEYPFKVQGLSYLDATDLQAKNDFYIYEKSLFDTINEKNWLGLLFALILIPLFIYFIIAFVKSFIAKSKYKKRKEKWIDLIEKAYSRDDFENLYQSKGEWKVYVENLTFLHFQNTINDYQFKESWSGEDLDSVKNSFEPIKRGLLND